MDNRHVAVVIIVALVVLAHPFVLFTDIGEPTYSLVVTEEASSAPDDAVVNYESLPESARERVDVALGDEQSERNADLSDAAIEALEGAAYVRTSEGTYRYRFERDPTTATHLLLFRYVVSGIAGTVLAVTLFRWFREGRSGIRIDDTGSGVNVTTAASGIVGAGLSVYSVQAHDALFTSAQTPLWPPTTGIYPFLFIAFAITWMLISSRVRRRIGAARS